MAKRRVSRAEQGALLDRVEARVRAAGAGALVVFDLDSTLLDNRPRQARILRDYGAAAGVAALAGARTEHWTDWDLSGAMRRAGCSEAEVEAHRRPLRAFWGARFFTSAYCRDDDAIAGAPEFARALLSAGAGLAYVTGRPRAMAAGTLEVFRRTGLPLPDGQRVRLLTRPDGESDDDWKLEAAALVSALGTVVAAFDNEPAHVNAYARSWPEAICVHLETDQSGRDVEVEPRVPSIGDFGR
jgi:beta-phosphoglucomutase-like phosphatase (HAD superfamily)